MSAVGDALGVDVEQWKALVKVQLKLDFRQMLLGRSQARMGRQVALGAMVFSQILFYTMFGIGVAVLVVASRDLFLIGMVLASYIFFIVGTAVLLDHNSIASPDDYAILGFRPVSSRTYFIARLTNALVYTTAMTTIAGYIPVAAIFVKFGVIVGGAALVMVLACGTSVALTILIVYTWMLRLLGADAIKRGLSYVQLATSFFIYGGYAIVPRLALRSAIARMALPETGWWLAYPASWFAAYLNIAAGHVGGFELAGVALSCVLMTSLLLTLGGRMSLDYSAQLGAITASPRRIRAARASTPGFWFRTGEARAVALLVRSQFKNDQRFRMAVLGILPMTVLYIYLGVSDGNLHDPFTGHFGGPPFVTMAVMLFPQLLRTSVTRSESYRGSWIFFTCPADRVAIIRASKNVLVVFFLLPYLIAVSAVYVWLVGNVPHVLVHMLLLGMLSYLALQILILANPELPFSKPPLKTSRSSSLFGLMIAITGAALLLQFFAPLIYRSLITTIALAAVLIGTSLLIDRLTRARVERQAPSLEFEG